MKDTIEFWLDEKVLLRVDSSMAPSVGSYVSIMKVTYLVERVGFAVDYSDSIHECQMRCNVELTRPK